MNLTSMLPKSLLALSIALTMGSTAAFGSGPATNADASFGSRFWGKQFNRWDGHHAPHKILHGVCR
jgi:hypothetical protein